MIQDKRACGVLLPVFSLPSRYGIGTFSKEAYEFVDILKKAGQSYWQVLPMGPTGFGDSPYQSFSAFAGNPYFIDLEELIELGYLSREACDRADFGKDQQDVDYGTMAQNRLPLLRIAYENWKAAWDEKKEGTTIIEFLDQYLSAETLEYCFYMAVKNSMGGKCWVEWDEDIRLRKPTAMAAYKEKYQDEIYFYAFQQYKAQEQWQKLRAYANKNGIRIIGDIPFYVSFDSADAWSHPELFQFDKDGNPTGVAGCPPDAFSATGQLWGNPLYKWPYHKKTGYAWWVERMEYCFMMFDVVRVDHFRGFDQYYNIPFGDETAENGEWEEGPGMDLFDTLKKKLGELDIIAEDLGMLTPSVLELVEKTGYPGMKILEFAFSADGKSTYLPYHYDKNCVVYTGTHDNDTLQSWFRCMPDWDRNFAMRYMGCEGAPWDSIHWNFIREALASTANLAVIPLQDYLGLGGEARINAPATCGKNWRWRMRPHMIGDDVIQKCFLMAWTFGRAE